MRERLQNAAIFLSLVCALFIAGAWVHSHLRGYQRTWSDSGREVCGRFVSRDGRLVWQRCSFKPIGLPESFSKYRLAMPQDFVVGSNPGGNRTTIRCGGLSVPFVMPGPGLWIGYNDRYMSRSGGAELTRWSAHWDEAVISYWLLLLAFLSAPLVRTVRRMLGLAKQKLGYGSFTDPAPPNPMPGPTAQSDQPAPCGR